MNFKLPQPSDRESPASFLANGIEHVSLKIARKFATHPARWMQPNSVRSRFLSGCLCAVLWAGCSKVPSVDSAQSNQMSPAEASVPAAEPQEKLESSNESEPGPEVSVGPPASEAEKTVDVGVLERRFVAATNNPKERIAIVQELADVPPAAALTTLNRLYPLERREDVKIEMLAVLGDFDHEANRDNQLALCLKALAPEQPPRVRYVAVQALGDLNDPRGHALLVSLTADKDRKVRAAAVQALDDEAP
jgi:HEAT repeat protein